MELVRVHVCTHAHKRGDSQETVHVVLDAGKSHNLPSVSRRPRKATGVIQSVSEGLRARGAISVNPSQRAGENMS